MQIAGGTRQAFAQSIEKGEGTCNERTVGFFIIIIILPSVDMFPREFKN